jgi:hypothetical protein
MVSIMARSVPFYEDKLGIPMKFRASIDPDGVPLSFGQAARK